MAVRRSVGTTFFSGPRGGEPACERTKLKERSSLWLCMKSARDTLGKSSDSLLPASGDVETPAVCNHTDKATQEAGSQVYLLLAPRTYT